MGNIIIVLEKGDEKVGANCIKFEDLDFEDQTLKAFHVHTDRSIYRCKITNSNVDVREPDTKRRDTFKLVQGGKKREKQKPKEMEKGCYGRK
jgi:hypothetical protein